MISRLLRLPHDLYEGTRHMHVAYTLRAPCSSFTQRNNPTNYWSLLDYLFDRELRVICALLSSQLKLRGQPPTERLEPGSLTSVSHWARPTSPPLVSYQLVFVRNDLPLIVAQRTRTMTNGRTPASTRSTSTRPPPKFSRSSTISRASTRTSRSTFYRGLL